MSLEEDLKKVIPASKEDIRIVEASKRRPLPPPDQIERQLRAAGAFRGRAPMKRENNNKRGQNKQQGS
jgi:hypothetical protein